MRHPVIGPWLGVLLLVAALAVPVRAADTVVVEDWAGHLAGAKGIPRGWKGQSWGSPKYDFTVVELGGRKALQLRSEDEGSTISKDVRVDLKATPVLEWSWKVVTLPRGGNSCVKATDDQALQVFVVWPRFPEAVRSRIIGYVWDTTAPVGTVCKSEKTGTVTYVVVRSGPADAGQWLTERRNVREDFLKIYGAAPDDPGAVAVAIDSNDTRSVSESFVGSIVFRRP
jgi:hypothetical protein